MVDDRDMQCAFVRIFMDIASSIKEERRRSIGIIIGKLLFVMMPRLRSVVNINLSLCFPSINYSSRIMLAKKTFYELGIAIMELPYLWHSKNEDALSIINKITGFDDVINAYKEGNGVLLYTAHFGSWESAILFISSKLNMSAVYKPMKNKCINKLIISYREQFGAKMIDKKYAVRQLVKSLRQGEAVGLLIDQNVDVTEGVFADFFNIPASTTPIISRLSQITGSAVFCVFAYRSQNGITLEFTRVDNQFIKNNDIYNTSLINSTIEAAVMRQPEQYWWFHKRFKARPNNLPSPY